MNTINVNGILKILSENEMKQVTGASGGAGGNECWHYCTDHNGGIVNIAYGTCYDAYHRCNASGWLTSCNCNG